MCCLETLHVWIESIWTQPNMVLSNIGQVPTWHVVSAEYLAELVDTFGVVCVVV